MLEQHDITSATKDNVSPLERSPEPEEKKKCNLSGSSCAFSVKALTIVEPDRLSGETCELLGIYSTYYMPVSLEHALLDIESHCNRLAALSFI